MLVLGLDTSTPAVSVALVDTELGVLGERVVVDGRRHGEVLAVGIRGVLTAAGCAPRDLGAVVVGLGPGPFTGLRVGIVTAASFGDALGIAVHGVCSLDGLAQPGRPTLAVTDARRREVYWAAYDGAGARVDGPHVDAPAVAREAATGRSVVGDGAQLYAFDGVLDVPRWPSVPALIARAPLTTAPGPLIPLYLRRPDAQEPPVPAAAALPG